MDVKSVTYSSVLSDKRERFLENSNNSRVENSSTVSASNSLMTHLWHCCCACFRSEHQRHSPQDTTTRASLGVMTSPSISLELLGSSGQSELVVIDQKTLNSRGAFCIPGLPFEPSWIQPQLLTGFSLERGHALACLHGSVGFIREIGKYLSEGIVHDSSRGDRFIWCVGAMIQTMQERYNPEYLPPHQLAGWAISELEKYLCLSGIVLGSSEDIGKIPLDSHDPYEYNYTALISSINNKISEAVDTKEKNEAAE